MVLKEKSINLLKVGFLAVFALLILQFSVFVGEDVLRKGNVVTTINGRIENKLLVQAS